MEWVCLCGVTISFLYAYMEKEAQQLPAAQKSTALLSLLDDFAILNTVRGKDFKQAKSEFAGLQKNYELLRRQKKVRRAATTICSRPKWRLFRRRSRAWWTA